MNPLTQVKNTQKITAREADLGISDSGSWHAKYKDSAYVYAGNLPFDLNEGDLLAVFAQYGEIVDINLVRDKGTGKSRGFVFIAYEDQRSTNLAVDNLNGASVTGRTIKVDHVGNYKRKLEEDEEELQRKREERGVCRAFQRGECTRGASCKFSHDENRCADTGYVPKDGHKWGHDKYEGKRDTNNRKFSTNYEDGSERHANRYHERERSEKDRREKFSRNDDRDRYQRRGNDQDEAPQRHNHHQSHKKRETARDERDSKHSRR